MCIERQIRSIYLGIIELLRLSVVRCNMYTTQRFTQEHYFLFSSDVTTDR